MTVSIFSQSVAEQNQILYLNFDNNNLIDQSNFPHTIIAHDVDLTEGISNEALKLNGQNNFLEVLHDSLLEIPDQVSISFWYLHEQQDGNGFYSLVEQSADEFGGHSRYGTWVFNQHSVMACIEPDLCPNGSSLCQRCIISETSLEIGNWYHIVSTYDGDSQKIYINGELDIEESYTQATGISVRPYPLTIGTDMYDPNPIYLKGAMDEIRLFNIALTAIQVDELYQQDMTSSTTEIKSEDQLVLFPTPSKDYIEFQSSEKLESYSIYDLKGTKLQSGILNSNKIEINELYSGIYILILEGKDRQLVKQFVVAK